MRIALLTFCSFFLFSAGCSTQSTEGTAPAEASLEKQERTTLASIIAARDEEQRARDPYRHPQKTLEFIGIEPGMKVVEVLPGRGWYTRILAPLVGEDGALYGLNYADSMWARFGRYDEETIAKLVARTAQFPEMVNALPGAENIMAKGFAMNAVDEALNGEIDAVVAIRAIHNLSRFEADAGTFTSAMNEFYGLLKPGGTLAIVQHRAPESASDESAAGQRGYLKQSAVIAAAEAAGFELVATSEINANSKDQPSDEDIVWRLPPSLNGSDEDEEKRAAMLAIGESDRMTLKFKK